VKIQEIIAYLSRAKFIYGVDKHPSRAQDATEVGTGSSLLRNGLER
jgi:hypothetical protein